METARLRRCQADESPAVDASALPRVRQISLVSACADPPTTGATFPQPTPENLAGLFRSEVQASEVQAATKE